MNKHGENFAIRGHQNRIPNKFGKAGHTIHEELFLKLVAVLLGDGRNLFAVYVGYATYYTDSLPYSNERQNISSGFIERNSTGGTSFFTIEPSLRAHKAGFLRSGKPHKDQRQGSRSAYTAPTNLTVRKDLQPVSSHYSRYRKPHSGFLPLRNRTERFYST